MRREIIFALACAAAAHESCCEKHKEQPAFIIDPNDAPPAVYEGEPRFIVDAPPAEWDDDEDGPYSSMIENPLYAWAPREIPNPKYVAPAPLWKRFADEVREAAPWVTIGAVVAAVLDAVPMPSFAGSGLRAPGVGGVVAGALVGLATPLCSCGVLPGAAALAAEGVPLGAVVAFLTAAQSSGLDSAAITYGLLGWRAALARLLGAVILACAAGLAVSGSQVKGKKGSMSDAHLDAKPLKGFGLKKVDAFAAAGIHTVGQLAHFALSDQALATKTELPVKTVSKWRDAASELLEPNNGGPSKKSATPATVVKTALKVAAEVFPSVLLGLAVSTTVLYYAPSLAKVHSAYGGAVGGVVLRLATLVATIPLQVCEHATVTLAAGVQKGGGSAGLAFAFLLAAPATNASSLLLLGSPSAVTRAVVALTAAALLLSYAVDAAGLDLLVVEENHAGGGGGLELPGWLEGQADVLVAGFVATTLYHAVRPARKGDACEDGCKED